MASNPEDQHDRRLPSPQWRSPQGTQQFPYHIPRRTIPIPPYPNDRRVHNMQLPPPTQHHMPTNRPYDPFTQSGNASSAFYEATSPHSAAPMHSSAFCSTNNHYCNHPPSYRSDDDHASQFQPHEYSHSTNSQSVAARPKSLSQRRMSRSPEADTPPAADAPSRSGHRNSKLRTSDNEKASLREQWQNDGSGSSMSNGSNDGSSPNESQERDEDEKSSREPGGSTQYQAPSHSATSKLQRDSSASSGSSRGSGSVPNQSSIPMARAEGERNGFAKSSQSSGDDDDRRGPSHQTSEADMSADVPAKCSSSEVFGSSEKSPQNGAGGPAKVKKTPGRKRHKLNTRFANAFIRPFEAPRDACEELLRTSRVVIRQHPKRARMIGFGEKDRRPIDPPPILELELQDKSELPLVMHITAANLVAHVSLVSECGQYERDMVVNPFAVPPSESGAMAPDTASLPQGSIRHLSHPNDRPHIHSGVPHTLASNTSSNAERISRHDSMSDGPRLDGAGPQESRPTPESKSFPSLRVAKLNQTHMQVLIGTLVSPCHILNDCGGQKGMFFVFPDVSVRVAGRYRLRFMVFDVRNAFLPNPPRKHVVLSDVFTVYHPKEFPGMADSTDLSKCLSHQGLRIHIRSDPKVKEGPDSKVA
ncbi:velvet factor-domain-containing protein [Fimicolochytrium jonesii]|uniref:velvet factor-domain-containing protein n=1 Tax=Fimicolochytrium jonesii TaxID=1396493 RepID=UPI0022FEED50|nr:velvet factor-domain-containing protein [Fimicolochytrium jonesii]KAI8820212.1 velvet factor-domain-containing protein [Fimicolochytrium jonesii]